jgi:hypothetical protein
MSGKLHVTAVAAVVTYEYADALVRGQARAGVRE